MKINKRKIEMIFLTEINRVSVKHEFKKLKR